MTAGPVGRTVWRNVAGTLACACCLVAAYAVARHKDGRREQRVMTRDEVLKRQSVATSTKK